MEDTTASWEKLLNPESLRQTLVAASVFLTAYEMLKEALVGHLKAFFVVDSWTPDKGWAASSEYCEKVLSLDKREAVACAMWFHEQGALDDEDLRALKEIADHRNTVAHELPSILGSQDKEVSLLHLRYIYLLTVKIDKWWLRYVEIPSNSSFDRISEEEIERSYSLRMLVMSMLVDVAEGNDSALIALYRQWREMIDKR